MSSSHQDKIDEKQYLDLLKSKYNLKMAEVRLPKLDLEQVQSTTKKTKAVTSSKSKQKRSTSTDKPKVARKSSQSRSKSRSNSRQRTVPNTKSNTLGAKVYTKVCYFVIAFFFYFMSCLIN